MLSCQGFPGGKFSKVPKGRVSKCDNIFQFGDPDMVKGFRYKLYSTVSDSDQLKKEEKVIFIVIALLLGRSLTIKLSTWQKKQTFCSISSDHKGIWISLDLK